MRSPTGGLIISSFTVNLDEYVFLFFSPLIYLVLPKELTGNRYHARLKAQV